MGLGHLLPSLCKTFIGPYNKSRFAYPATPLTCIRKVLLSCLSLSAYMVLCSNELNALYC